MLKITNITRRKSKKDKHHNGQKKQTGKSRQNTTKKSKD